MSRQPSPRLEALEARLVLSTTKPTLSLDATATVQVAVSERALAIVNPVTRLLVSNRPPNTAPDYATTTVGKPVWVSPTKNDRDPEGGRLEIVSVTKPLNGTIERGVTIMSLPTSNEPEKLLYTPRPGFVGTDRFTYTVRDPQGATRREVVWIKVGDSVNQLPIAVDDTRGTRIRSAMTIDVLANDRDADGDVLSVVSFAGTTERGGIVRRETKDPNKLVYTPPTNLVGAETFNYTISDGHGGQAVGRVKLLIMPNWCGTPIPSLTGDLVAAMSV